MIMEVQEAVHPTYLSAYFTRFPALSALFDEMAERNLKFEMHARRDGAEFRLLNSVNGMPNRGYLRIFFPSETKCLLFFHKKSSVPYSHDRFSYGGIVIDERSAGRFQKEDVFEWISFLFSGLQPKFRPNHLKKSFPYTVPED
jgi:hypothetical protein